jgi:hypothetical protein
VGIVGSIAASSAQLKGAEEIVLVAGIGGSEMGIGKGIDSENVTVGSEDSVCMDIDAEDDEGMIRGFVWTEAVAAVAVGVTRWSVWTLAEMEVVTVSI